jgi:hypothetical protein
VPIVNVFATLLWRTAVSNKAIHGSFRKVSHAAAQQILPQARDYA